MIIYRHGFFLHYHIEPLPKVPTISYQVLKNTSDVYELGMVISNGNKNNIQKRLDNGFLFFIISKEKERKSMQKERKRIR